MSNEQGGIERGGTERGGIGRGEIVPGGIVPGGIHHGGLGGKKQARAIPADAEATEIETANDRFKRSFGLWFWSSMITATVFHFVIFQFWPTQTVVDFGNASDELPVIDILPELEIPPPPERIAQPAIPVSSLTVDEDITIGTTTFPEDPPEIFIPPPRNGEVGDLSTPVFDTPVTIRPEIKNMPEVQAALMREYPTILRDAGIGGTVSVAFFISEEGLVLDRRVYQSSGHTPLDEAALQVADVIRFSPAMNRENVVRLWIRLPITFEVR